jgi:hypothetical protein
MPGIQDQHDELALINRVEKPVVTDPDPQDPVRARDHLCPGRPGIGAESIDCVRDSAAYWPV